MTVAIVAKAKDHLVLEDVAEKEGRPRALSRPCRETLERDGTELVVGVDLIEVTKDGETDKRYVDWRRGGR